MSVDNSRSLALDVFRGLAIAGMILVNNPGSWSDLYAPLRHAQWHGCTPTDLVFPFFLFASGAAMFFSFAKSSYRATPQVLRGIVRRSALLVLLGVLLNAYPFLEPLSQWRLPGVLQRIGIAYGIAALLILYCPGPRRWVAGALLLLVYWWLLLAFGGDAPYALETNLVRRLDLALLGEQHLWQGLGLAFDPEGLLSTLPAVVSVLFGFEAARIFRRAAGLPQAMLRLSLGGGLAVVLGLLWHTMMPINKSLWTGSYVLYTSGIGFLTLAVLILLVDRLQWRWLATPLQIYGTNPLFVYILAGVWARTLMLIDVPVSGADPVSLAQWLYQQCLLLASPINASLLYALAHVVLFWLVSWGLYRRGIVIKL